LVRRFLQGGTAFSALVVDLTSERERPRVLAVVWGMRLLGVLLGSAFVARLFGAACEEGASADALKTRAGTVDFGGSVAAVWAC
jgi:BCD family chlorophyll transporter-like MFS transporter